MIHSPIQVAFAIFLVVASASLIGCTNGESVPEKSPRVVAVIPLSNDIESSNHSVTGLVGSWKTEDIGFEVTGRVVKVLEPGEDIEGRVFNQEGVLVTEGTPIAQIETERYDRAVIAAQAQLDVAKATEEGLEVQLDHALPAELAVANAELELARLERDRKQRLVDQNAGSLAELEQAEANYQIKLANVEANDAKKLKAEADLASAVASVLQAQQSLDDALENQFNTTLYSSFRGQVADVHIVPGSVVSQGSPAVTIQMMDPIKIEFEMSAEDSRKMRKGRTVQISFLDPNTGEPDTRDAYIYQIDAAADPVTRTFTLTLLVLNEKVDNPVPETFDSETMIRTEGLWRLKMEFLQNDDAGSYLIDTKAIRSDELGEFIWLCKNASVGSPIPELLEVEKLRISRLDFQLPFLSTWNFQSVVIDEQANVDASTALFAGELWGVSDPDNWNGSGMIVDEGSKWLFRPGDLVSIDFVAEGRVDGYYVPMDAVYEQAGQYFLFVIDSVDESDLGSARRVEVRMTEEETLDADEYRHVVPVRTEDLSDGIFLVTEGVHYLNDGQDVRIHRASN